MMNDEKPSDPEQNPSDPANNHPFPENEDIVGLNKTERFNLHTAPTMVGKRLSKKARIILFSGASLIGILVMVGILMSGHSGHEGNAGSGGETADGSQIGTAAPPAPPPMLSPSSPVPSSTGSSGSSGEEKIGGSRGTPMSSAPHQARGVETTTNTTPPSLKLSERTSALNAYHHWRIREHYHFLKSRIKADYAAYDAPLSTGGAGMMQPTSMPATSPLSPRGTGSSMPDLARSQLDLLKHYESRRPGKNKSKTWNPEAKGSGYLTARLKNPKSTHEILAGSVIPAEMITGINSDLPGEITAQVRQTVYNSLNPSQVLIPQGSRLVGVYDSGIAYGQSRVMVAWTRLILPDGQTLDLGAMSGVDGQGEAGFHDQVDNHYLRIFGSAFLISLLGTGAQLSQPQSSGMYSTPTATQQAIASMSEEWNNVGSQLLQKNLNIKPTLIIQPGYEFNVFVRKTIILPAWRP